MEARFWRRVTEGRVACDLCPQGCVIPEGRAGLCRVRRVRDGALEAAGYGHVSSTAMDPIEKKPLYHFRPGSTIFSVGGWGCNLRCAFCQNWTISQQFVAGGRDVSPERVVAEAAASGSRAIAYTYNEPIVGYEFVADCAGLARARGLANVLVTNGFIRPEPAAALLPLVDALNIDIKSMDDGFYREQCGGRLAPVLDFARQARAAGAHVEITNLVIPGLNDGAAAFRALAEWMASNLGPLAPLHLSAYFPRHRMDIAATPYEALEEGWRVCRERLAYVYIGNVHGHAAGRDTACPACGCVLIARSGHATRVTGIEEGKCRECGRAADVVFETPRP